MAVWALFRIEFISGHAKHVVALDAHAMNVALCGLRLGRFACALSRRRRAVVHGGHSITPRKAMSARWAFLGGHGKTKGRQGTVWRNGVTS